MFFCKWRDLELQELEISQNATCVKKAVRLIADTTPLQKLDYTWPRQILQYDLSDSFALQ